MKLWSEFLDDLLPWLPGCEGNIVEHTVKRVAQDFFRRSRAWRIALDPIDVADGEAEIDLRTNFPTQAVVRLESVSLQGRKLPVWSTHDLIMELGGDWPEMNGPPIAATQLRPGTLMLVPKPMVSVPEGLFVVLSACPGDDAEGIDDDLYQQFGAAIVEGARAMLLAMPGKPWSDANLVGPFASRYEAAIDAARVIGARAHADGRFRSRLVWC